MKLIDKVHLCDPHECTAVCKRAYDRGQMNLRKAKGQIG